MPRHWIVFGLACCAALPAAYTLDPRLDVDTWWHMATGRWIVANSDVPWTDPFSAMSRQNPVRWYAYSWLYEVAAYKVFTDDEHFDRMMLFRSALVAFSTGTVFSFAVWRLGWTLRLLVVLLPTAIVLMMFAKERPWHFTIAFTTLTLAAVQYWREKGMGWEALALLPLFALWANLHIQFVLGWLVIGCAVLFPGAAKRWQFLILLFGSIAAIGLNPYHYRLFVVIVEYATQNEARGFINELAPPEWDAISTWAAVFVSIMGIASWVRSQTRDRFAIVVWLAGLILSLHMRRDLWLISLAAINLNCLSRICDSRTLVLRSSRVCAGVAAVVFAARLANSAGLGPTPVSARVDFLRVDPISPCVRFAGLDRTPGRYFVIYTTMEHASELIWSSRLSLLACNFDGRTNLYGDQRLRQHFKAWVHHQWDQDPDFITADYIVVPCNHPLEQVLSRDPAISPMGCHDDDPKFKWFRRWKY